MVWVKGRGVVIIERGRLRFWFVGKRFVELFFKQLVVLVFLDKSLHNRSLRLEIIVNRIFVSSVDKECCQLLHVLSLLPFIFIENNRFRSVNILWEKQEEFFLIFLSPLQQGFVLLFFLGFRVFFLDYLFDFFNFFCGSIKIILWDFLSVLLFSFLIG